MGKSNRRPTGIALPFEGQPLQGHSGIKAMPDGTFWVLTDNGLGTRADSMDSMLYLNRHFDVASEKFTGRFWHYAFEQTGNAIGDFNMIDGTSDPVIERDNFECTAAKTCAAGIKGTDCFADIAKFKRVYKIELNDANVGKPVRKIGFIDLLQITDPNKKARDNLDNGVLTFPFFTIETVDRVDATHIIIGNDNNLPFSSSRDAIKPMTMSLYFSKSAIF